MGGQRTAHWRFGAELSVSEGSRRLADRPSPPLRIIPPVPPLRVGPLRLLLLVLLVPFHLSLSLRPSCADHADVGLGHRPRLHPSQVDFLRFVSGGGRYSREIAPALCVVWPEISRRLCCELCRNSATVERRGETAQRREGSNAGPCPYVWPWLSRNVLWYTSGCSAECRRSCVAHCA